MRTEIVIIALAALFADPAGVDAQVAIGVIAGQSSQAEGKRDSPYLGPGFGGSPLAGIGMIDIAVTPRLQETLTDYVWRLGG
jgi:hypothetical protein